MERSRQCCSQKSERLTPGQPFSIQQTAKMAEALLSLLVPVLAQTFLTFVRSHLMSLSFFTAWHNQKILNYFFTMFTNTFAGLKAGTS